MTKEVLEKLVTVSNGLNQVKTSGDDSIIMVQSMLQLRDAINSLATIVREAAAKETE